MAFAFSSANLQAEINWLTNYEEALSQARSSSKPVILFFTGSDWCGWCHKLEKEVLNTPEFANLAGNQFIFVMLDFPLYKQADPKIAEQNKQLQRTFDVKGYPSLVIIDKDSQVIGTTGYRPGGPKSYADYLNKLVNDFKNYKQKVSEAEKKKLSASDIKELHQYANQLGREDEAIKLINLGLDTEDKTYFLLERFRSLAIEGKIHDPDAQALKREVQILDPNNEKGTLYEIAVIEFEAYSEEMMMQNTSAELAVEPLVNYIDKFGSKNKEQLWKIQMIISQVFLDKNKLQQALDYAKASYETAPAPIKTEIATAVKNIQSQLNKR
jgi:protein disulfide-isomerase